MTVISVTWGKEANEQKHNSGVSAFFSLHISLTVDYSTQISREISVVKPLDNLQDRYDNHFDAGRFAWCVQTPLLDAREFFNEAIKPFFMMASVLDLRKDEWWALWLSPKRLSAHEGRLWPLPYLVGRWDKLTRKLLSLLSFAYLFLDTSLPSGIQMLAMVAESKTLLWLLQFINFPFIKSVLFTAE